jgi:hypothetical protein
VIDLAGASQRQLVDALAGYGNYSNCSTARLSSWLDLFQVASVTQNGFNEGGAELGPSYSRSPRHRSAPSLTPIFRAEWAAGAASTFDVRLSRPHDFAISARAITAAPHLRNVREAGRVKPLNA